MFWEVRRDGLTQEEVAAKYGVSQQRVSAILRRMALYVALAPSKEYENIPQLGQLQYTYRIWLERMEQRRGDVHKAFLQSMQMQTTVKTLDAGKQMAGEPFFPSPLAESKTGDQAEAEGAQPAKPTRSPGKGSYTQWKKESIGKTQNGDWRLDKMLERIDQSISETRIVLYGRNWHGWELLEKSQMTRSGGRKKKRKQKKMRNAELGMRNEGGEAAVVDSAATDVAKPEVPPVVVDVATLVPSTEYSVPGTEPVETPFVTAESAAVVQVTLAASTPPSTLASPPSVAPAASIDSAFPIPSSALAEPAKRVRPPAISKITGRRIEAPALKTPEFLREHGLDPADYGGGRSDDPGPIWITGPDPAEVLSRDVTKMTDDEYAQYLKDIAFMKAYGSYREPDRRKSIVMHDKHYYR